MNAVADRYRHITTLEDGVIEGGLGSAVLEFLIAKAFDLHSSFHWSAFPLVGCFILGMGLIIIAINKPIQDALRKKLFF